MPTSAHTFAFIAVRGFLERVFASAEGESLETVASLDLSFTQARLLFVLTVQDGPVAISDLADLVGLSPATVGRNVDRLVRKKLLTRTENPEDRRVKLVAASERGDRIAAAHLKSKEDALRNLLADLSADQCVALVDALEPLKKEHHDS